mmetsp:Transcript_89323/g.227203  ORF Transcript_89323/g.227203 Transcript_89323/m.227203 type:complete len:81 (+) Transcript_89323:1174-1416(+)
MQMQGSRGLQHKPRWKAVSSLRCLQPKRQHHLQLPQWTQLKTVSNPVHLQQQPRVCHSQMPKFQLRGNSERLLDNRVVRA